MPKDWIEMKEILGNRHVLVPTAINCAQNALLFDNTHANIILLSEYI